MPRNTTRLRTGLIDAIAVELHDVKAERDALAARLAVEEAHGEEYQRELRELRARLAEAERLIRDQIELCHQFGWECVPLCQFVDYRATVNESVQQGDGNG